MGALRWTGYIVAAIAVLTVVVGVGMFVATVVAIGGVVVCASIFVMLCAAFIKDYCENVLTSKRR